MNKAVSKPIAVRVRNSVGEEDRILGFQDIETARNYSNRRIRSQIEANLRPNNGDPENPLVDRLGRIVLPPSQLRHRASFGVESIHVEGDDQDILEMKLESFLGNPATSQREVDFKEIEQDLGLVTWRIFSPAGTKRLDELFFEDSNLRAWFLSPFWMHFIRHSVLETFHIPVEFQSRLHPAPYPSTEGDLMFYEFVDIRKDVGTRFPYAVTVGQKVDNELNPVGEPMPFVTTEEEQRVKAQLFADMEK